MVKRLFFLLLLLVAVTSTAQQAPPPWSGYDGYVNCGCPNPGALTDGQISNLLSGSGFQIGSVLLIVSANAQSAIQVQRAVGMGGFSGLVMNPGTTGPLGNSNPYDPNDMESCYLCVNTQPY